MDVEERIIEETIWEEPSIKGKSLSPESSRSFSLGFYGKSSIAVVSVDHSRSRPHLELHGEIPHL
jgi:hypothetical protein